MFLSVILLDKGIIRENGRRGHETKPWEEILSLLKHQDNEPHKVPGRYKQGKNKHTNWEAHPQKEEQTKDVQI